jgi:hypothetical protein
VDDRYRLYRALVRLYPRRFRRDYGEDLVLHFGDLVADRGTRAAWARTSLDLLITVPRYHLEQIMKEQHSNTALNVVIGLLAAAWIGTVLVGSRLGPLVLVAAGVLAATQRSALAKALRVPDSGRRRRRLVTAALLGATFAASYVVFVLTVGDRWTITDTVLSIIGTVALFGAVGYLVAGLATPRTPDHGRLAGTG